MILPTMTLNELNEWMKEADPVHWMEDYDDRSNLHECRIYFYKNHHYAVYFCNDHPCEVFGDKGYIREHYHPMLVTMKTRTIQVDEWFHENGKSIDWFM